MDFSSALNNEQSLSPNVSAPSTWTAQPNVAPQATNTADIFNNQPVAGPSQYPANIQQDDMVPTDLSNDQSWNHVRLGPLNRSSTPYRLSSGPPNLPPTPRYHPYLPTSEPVYRPSPKLEMNYIATPKQEYKYAKMLGTSRSRPVSVGSDGDFSDETLRRHQIADLIEDKGTSQSPCDRCKSVRHGPGKHSRPARDCKSLPGYAKCGHCSRTAKPCIFTRTDGDITPRATSSLVPVKKARFTKRSRADSEDSLAILSESSAAFTDISSNDVLSRGDIARGLTVQITHAEDVWDDREKQFERDKTFFANLIRGLIRLRDATQHH